MANYTWIDTNLQITDLPEKAQRFVDMVNIDLNFIPPASLNKLKTIHLKANPHGHI